MFAAETHGYDTVDHLRIDPRLGDDADFDALVAAAHDRGPAGAARRRVQPRRPRAPGVPGRARRRARRADGRRGSGCAGRGGPDAEPEYDTFEGHGQLVALNHSAPAVADYVTDVMTHWLDRGADGWRLDAAYAVPTSFWATVLPRVRDAAPGRLLRRRGHPRRLRRVVRESGLDAVTQYELWKAIWSSLNDGNLHELAHALGRHDEFLDVVRAADVRRQPRRHPDRQPAHRRRGTCRTRWRCCSPSAAPRRSTPATSRRSPGSRRTGPVGTTPSGRPSRPSPDELAPYGWPTYRLHQELIGAPPPAPLAAPGPDDAAAPGQPPAQLRGRDRRRPAAGRGAEPGRRPGRACRRRARRGARRRRAPCSRDAVAAGRARLGHPGRVSNRTAAARNGRSARRRRPCT